MHCSRGVQTWPNCLEGATIVTIVRAVRFA